MRYLDANIFLRYLVKDTNPKNRAKRADCKKLFAALKAGTETATTCEAIITEIAYVLSSKRHYGLTHEQVRARMAPILALRGLRLPRTLIYRRALELYAGYAFLDFEDAICIADVEGRRGLQLYSYDARWDKVEGVDRHEPELSEPREAEEGRAQAA